MQGGDTNTIFCQFLQKHRHKKFIKQQKPTIKSRKATRGSHGHPFEPPLATFAYNITSNYR